MIDVVLADDHRIVREGVKQILLDCGDIVVVGEAQESDELMTVLRLTTPNVLVTDLSMPGKSGIELIKLIKREHPKLPVLVFSMFKEDQFALRCIRAGASGYLCKDAAPDLLVTAIRRIALGRLSMSPEVAESLLRDPGVQSTHDIACLSEREFEVLSRMARGQTVTEIARTLFVSVKTVSTHKARLMQKMGFANSADIVRYALNNNLIEENLP
ncbi:DNA-binding response regulator [Pseudomonas sp. 31-12]|uniref:response regulator n=1 Tax=Pseudomonas sp. 31-12 TaxID=2201356 RepID=UPI000D6DA247|nr:response regulator transcription factor [Pseudomonas sp. 31-12]AWM93738.1 DNA-binding response regulator [Pseudomonas sp. 31-12]